MFQDRLLGYSALPMTAHFGIRSGDTTYLGWLNLFISYDLRGNLIFIAKMSSSVQDGTIRGNDSENYQLCW